MTRIAGRLFFLLLLLLALRGEAQVKHAPTAIGLRECYLYTQLDDEDGLPQNSVMAAFVDPATGFLWIATQGGIARYDGHTVINYNAKDNLFSKRFVTIVGTETGQVFTLALDGSIFTFKQNELLYVSDNKLTTNVSPFIYFRGGLCDSSQLNKVSALANLQGRELLPSINSLIPVDRNILLVCSRDRLLQYRNNKLEKTIPFPDIAGYRLVKQNKKVYFINNSLEGYRYDPATGVLRRLGKEGQLPVMPGSNHVEQVYLAPYSDYLSGQINCWARDTFYQLQITDDKIGVAAAYHVPDMPDDAVVGFLHEKKQVIVIGSSSKGIYLYRIQQFRQILKDAGRYTSIYAQILADSNRLVTSQSWIYNLKTHTPEQNIYTTQARQIRSFSKDREGRIYYSWANKLYRLDPATASPVIAFACDSCRDINFTFFDTTDNRFWMVSQDRTGYWEDNTFYPVTWANEPVTPVISTIRHEPGYPLTASTSNGIWYYAPEHRQWIVYPQTLGRIYRYFTPEKKGMSIITSYGEGFALWNRKTQELTPLPTDRNGYLKFVHTVIPDHQGYVWATTNKGLFRYREADVLAYNKNTGQNLYYEYYDRKEGLQTNEFNGAQYPIFNWWNRYLLLSTINGITIFQPDVMPDYSFDEPLYVEAVFRSDGEKIDMVAGANGRHQFSSSERDLKFQISTAAWHNIYGLVIEYKLDAHGSWRQVDTRKMELVLSALGAGNHTLHIRKKKGFGNVDYIYRTFSFNVKRRYYEHPFFVFALAVCGLGILLIFSRLRQLRLIRINKKLSHMVSKKTKELQQSNQQLKQSLHKIEQSQNFRLRLISMLLHDIATPLSSVEKISDMLTHHFERLDAGTRIEGAGKINRTIRELQALSRQLIDWAQVNLHTGEPVYRQITLQKLVEEVNTVMEGHLFTAKYNEYACDYKPEEKIISDPTVLKHIILNVLFNANKYTQRGKITMRLYRENAQLHILVRDTGTGMHPETAAQLNAYTSITQSEIKSGTAMELGWGLGYQIIFDLLAILSGSLHVNSIPNEGTEILIIIPIKQQGKGNKK